MHAVVPDDDTVKIKECYVDIVSRGILDVHDLHGDSLLAVAGRDTWRISRVNVPRASRNQGIGSYLMRRVCADADADGLCLVLEASGDEDALFGQSLIDWYKRFGFVDKYDHTPGVMYRLPKESGE